MNFFCESRIEDGDFSSCLINDNASKIHLLSPIIECFLIDLQVYTQDRSRMYYILKKQKLKSKFQFIIVSNQSARLAGKTNS